MTKLEQIYQEISVCQKCELHKNRKSTYRYRGNPNSDIVFIGEALGEQEQIKGLPFVGRSGKLLDSLLKEIGLTEEHFYITNLVKDRPPNNRDPLFHEIEACKHFLIEELRYIDPKLIITLGKVSSRWFNLNKPFEWYEFNKRRRWMPVFHPAYLIRQSKDVRKNWQHKILEKVLLLNCSYDSHLVEKDFLK